MVGHLKTLCNIVSLNGHISKYLLIKNSFPKNGVRYRSSLYISGRNANKQFALLTPYLDFDKRFLDVNQLQKEFTLRGINLDVTEAKNAWEFYKHVNENKEALESMQKEIGNLLAKLIQKPERTSKEEQEIVKLRIQGKVIKQDLKLVKDTLWDLDEMIIEKLLKLPNDLDKKTPKESATILKRVGKIRDFPENQKSHIEIGRTLGLLEYRDPINCYLCNDAALFELGVLNIAGKVLSDNNMIRVAGSDFSRSILVEGSGLNHEDPMDTFILQKDRSNESSRTHLVGGASLISFLALHTKQLINASYFPVKYFATGRQYTPFPKGSVPLGLFTVCQSSVAHVFLMLKNMNSEEYLTEFENVLKTVCSLYDKVCDHYQVVIRAASELKPWESMRISFELWSPFTKQYIEVGHISTYGEYFSKRLLIGYEGPTGKGFSSIISGTVLSVPRLLGCILEQNSEKLVIPPEILKHMPIEYNTNSR